MSVWKRNDLLTKAATDLQKLVRLEASDAHGMVECVTCGKRVHYKQANGGHYLTRGKPGTKIDEMNVHPQCVSCNHPRSGAGKPEEYHKYLIRTYGKRKVNALIRRGNGPGPEYGEILEARKGFKVRIKDQILRLNAGMTQAEWEGMKD